MSERSYIDPRETLGKLADIMPEDVAALARSLYVDTITEDPEEGLQTIEVDGAELITGEIVTKETGGTRNEVLHVLSENEHLDAIIKREIIEFISSGVGRGIPLRNKIDDLVRYGFKREIDQRKLLEYLTDDRVLKIHIFGKVSEISGKRGEKEVDEDINSILEASLTEFMEHYNPEYLEYDMSEYVNELQGQYHEYDIIKWFEKTENIELLLGFFRQKVLDLGHRACLRHNHLEGLRGTPALFDDHSKDMRTKFEFARYLSGDMVTKSSLNDQLKLIIDSAYEKGIDIERLIRFLSSNGILEIIVDEVIQSKTQNHEADFEEKLEVDKEMSDYFFDCLDDFQRQYNPLVQSQNASTWVTRLKEKFRDYDVQAWLASYETKMIFIGILEEHISPIVEKTYLQEAKRRIALATGEMQRAKIKEFLNLYMDGIFYKTKTTEYGAEEDVENYIFDTEELLFMFSELLPKVQTAMNPMGINDLKKIVLELCKEKMKVGADFYRLVEILDTGGRVERNIYDNINDFIEEIGDIFEGYRLKLEAEIAISNMSKYQNITNENLIQHYNDWYDNEGQLIKDNYYRYLAEERGESIDNEISKDKMMDLERGWIDVFEGVNKYLEGVSEKLGIRISDFQYIVAANDIAELTKIACKAGSEKERFEAKRKLSLAMLADKIIHDPSYAFLDSNVRRVYEKFKNAGNLEILDREKKSFYFIDKPDGKVEQVKDDKGIITNQILEAELKNKVDIDGETYFILDENHPNAEEILSNIANVEFKHGEYEGKGCYLIKAPSDEYIREVRLIPAKFHGIDVYLMPVNREDTESNDYIRMKSLESAMTKSLRGRETQDWEAMTIVVDSMKKFEDVKKILRTKYSGYCKGRLIKDEDTREGNRAYNKSKSEGYETSRRVIYVPLNINGRVIYIALETRLFVMDEDNKDLFVAMSKYNHAGHDEYENRRLLEIVKMLLPQKIYPDKWEYVDARETDLFESRTSRLQQVP